MSIDLARKLARLGRPRVLVVGDMILDEDLHGRYTRYAQEAPGVPVFEQESHASRPGGAGAVAEMCRALGATVELVAPAQPSVKTRAFVDGRLVSRLDFDAGPITAEEAAALAYRVSEAVGEAQAVLVADYGKAGARAYPYLRAAIDGAKARGIPCIVDPARGTDWKTYHGAKWIKCNEREWESGDADQVEEVIVTRGENGIDIIHWRRGMGTVKARPRNVVDVTGAGDMVLAALGVCIACGMDRFDAAKIANAAAGLKCERRGAVGVSRAEVIADLLFPLKVLPADLLPAVAQAQHARDRKVVFTNGCFDLLHAGHLFALETARKMGDFLIVGLNSDASVRALKGPGRPVQDEDTRAAVLAGLSCVDAVCLFDESPAALAELVRPAVMVKGSDWRGCEIIGAEFAGEVVYVPRMPGRSTTETVARMGEAVPC